VGCIPQLSVLCGSLLYCFGLESCQLQSLIFSHKEVQDFVETLFGFDIFMSHSMKMGVFNRDMESNCG